jgi:translation initiation factor IF-2
LQESLILRTIAEAITLSLFEGNRNLKIRVFTLAKELGLGSKELIDHCNQAGVHLKPSALASITQDEKNVVLKYLNEQRSAGTATATQERIASVRDESRDLGGKVRAIPISKSRSLSKGGKSTKSSEITGVIDDIEKTIQEEALTDSATQTSSTKTADEKGSVAQPIKKKEGETDPSIRKSFISASGGSAGSRIREMKPRGTVPGSSTGGSRQNKIKSKPALPNVAVPPSYSPPKPKTPSVQEKKSPQPDIPLTAEVIEQQSPLRAHLQQKKTKKKDTSETRSPSQRGGRPPNQIDEKDQLVRREKPKRRRQNQENFAPGQRNRRGMGHRRQKSRDPIVRKTSAVIELPISLRGFSEAVGRPIRELMSYLFQQGTLITINDNLPEETCLELGLEMGVDLEFKRERDLEQELVKTLVVDETEENLEIRPPVVTILGHVDHGKTTLLDKIRLENVASGEAGGITQHIAAYQVNHGGRLLTFVDTPGHAAFGEMRARGANVTDIVVLVVAADDGVMPQTVECISHAKAANVPVVVAMNKTDLPDADEQKVLQDLANYDVLPAEWGGDVEVIRTSALTGDGLESLLETLLVTSELQEFKANPNCSAVGVCLEAFMDEGRGPLAWVIVQNGTLKIGDFAVCGRAFGRIRAIYDDRNQEVPEAGPSSPVKVAGLDIIPGAGDQFYVMSDLDDARKVTESRKHAGRTEVLAGQSLPQTLEDILEVARGGTTQELPLIIKTDTPGSLEALRSELDKFEHPEVQIQIVHEGVGGVNESDVSLAEASGAIIIAFHVVPEDRALQMAEQTGVDIRRYSIIYEVTETIKRALEGLLEPERVQVMTGRTLVLRTFHISRYGTIAGCRVLSGTIERSQRVNVIRDQTILNDYSIASLKREKDDAREVREGLECGIRLEGFNDVKEGDLLEAFRIDEIKRTLES